RRGGGDPDPDLPDFRAAHHTGAESHDGWHFHGGQHWTFLRAATAVRGDPVASCQMKTAARIGRRYQAWRMYRLQAGGRLYTRPRPSIFSEATSRPSFFLRAPAIAPRTVCGCQPVAATISAMVAPPGARSIAISAACLVPSRGVRVVGAALC